MFDTSPRDRHGNVLDSELNQELLTTKLYGLPGVAKNTALPVLVWVEVKSSTMEINCSLEMLHVAEATSRFLYPLGRRVEGFDSALVCHAAGR